MTINHKGRRPFLDQNDVLYLPQTTMVVLCGPSGSGKSSFAAQNWPETYVISSDHCRALVCDNMRSMEVSEEAFGLVHYISRLRLKFRRPTVIDSTALYDFSRRALLQIARDYGYQSLLLAFNTPPEVCQARDAARTNPPPVGPEVIAEQFRLFHQTIASAAYEGFGTVIVLEPAQIGRLRVEIVPEND